MKNPSLTGSLMVLLAAMFWGTTGTAQSFAPAQLPAQWVGALRLAMSALFFLAYVGLTQPRARLLADLRAMPWGRVLFAGTCVAAYNLSFFAGVKASGVAIGTAIAIGSGPLWAGLLQWLLAGQAPRPAWWIGTLLAVAGGAAMVLSGSGGAPLSPVGIGLCLVAGLSYAVYALVNQRLVRQAAPSTVTLLVFGTAALIAVPAAVWWVGAPAAMSAGGWLVVGYLGVVATGLAYLLFSSALRHISAATGVTLALAEPLTAFVLAVLVVHEQPALGAFAGLALVLAGLAVVIWAEVRGTARLQHQ
ncbi:EamA family transporter [Rhodoferax koreense]|uniref:EamA family transporter n=1 Tax=Rhodoferax koreensis TaxID=1842727 RepID=A0A1P8JY34_9BURK|nr:EamA family transporter [Rhodoferax koreense]APW38656.1 EamA family transporter [Rhodoferax koreense]